MGSTREAAVVRARDFFARFDDLANLSGRRRQTELGKPIDMSGRVDLLMETEYRVVTCADANFFHFLPVLEENVRRKTGQYPVIYDLGLLASQRARLKSEIVSLTPPEGYNKKVPKGAIRTHHKPDCLLDFVARFRQDVLYLDADVLMVDNLPANAFVGCDVAVTPRHPKELLAGDPFRNGRLNAGVMYFANNREAHALLEQWRALCSEGIHTDQMAISDILEPTDLNGPLGIATLGGLRVLKLDPRVYNDVACRTGRLWHFKNAGRRFHKKRRWWAAAMKERITPRRFAARVARARDALD